MKKLKGLLLVLVVALLILTASTSATAAKPPIQEGVVVWQLTKANIVSQGQTSMTGEGTLTTGFIVEAMAKSRYDNLVKNGTFRLELSLFMPKKDMPGQKAGRWYVNGKWAIDANGKPADARKNRHQPGIAQGLIQGDLDFNPITESRNWTASAILPMSTTDTRWMKGNGALSVGPAWEGDLFLQLNLWPQAQLKR